MLNRDYCLDFPENPDYTPDPVLTSSGEETLPADQNPARIYLASLAPDSRDSMRSALEAVVATLSLREVSIESFPWHLVRIAHLESARARWKENDLAPATINARLSAVRGTLKRAWQLGLIDTDTYTRTTGVSNVRGARMPAGRVLSRKELDALFQACANDTSPIGARDAALLAVLCGTGAKLNELAALTLANFNVEQRCLDVIGRGSRQRIIFLPDGAYSAVLAWLDHRGRGHGALFNPVRKGGRIVVGRGLSSQAISSRIKERCRQAGVKECSSHDFRRSYISKALAGRVDVAAIAASVGHASIATTARYGRIEKLALREAADAIDVPYEPGNAAEGGNHG